MVVVCAVLSVACSQNKNVNSDATTTTTIPLTELQSNEVTTEVATAESTEATTEIIKNECLTNDTGKLVIRRLPLTGAEDYTYLIISKEGTSILCEPQTPKNDIIPDILAFSHDHHRDMSLILRLKKDNPETFISQGDADSLGTEKVKGVTITGIAASHKDDPIQPDNPSLVMQVFDVDDMRIAYIGDVGQIEFTKEQMDALGEVDIALITLDDFTGWISVEKSIQLAKQLNPKIIIPIKHTNPNFEDAIDQLNQEFPVKEEFTEEWTISKEELNSSEQKIVVINHVD